VTDEDVPEALRDAAAPVTIVAERRLSDGFRPLDHFEIELPNDPQPLDRDVLRSGACVALVAVDVQRDSLVMLRQFRMPAHLATGKGDLVEFVAGRLEPGEDPLAAVHREALEEIGLEIGAPVQILRFLPSPGITDEFATMFAAQVDSSRTPARAGLATENETTRPFAVPIDAALGALAAGTVANAYTVIGLQWVALNRHRLAEVLPRG
jgi:ADP-ribose pyrophosphatase